jgi:hypothetical protein
MHPKYWVLPIVLLCSFWLNLILSALNDEIKDYLTEIICLILDSKPVSSFKPV